MKVTLDFAILTLLLAIAIGITFPKCVYWLHTAKNKKNFSLVFIKSVIYHTFFITISYVVFLLTFVSGSSSSQGPNWIFVVAVFLLFLASEAVFESRVVYSNQRSNGFLKAENSNKNELFERKIKFMEAVGAISFLCAIGLFYMFTIWIHNYQIYQNIFFVCWNLIGGMVMSIVSIFIWKIAAKL